jgi:type II secretory pathway component PulJ
MKRAYPRGPFCRRGSSGFALLEVLLALSLLSIGIVSVLGSLQNSVRVVRDAGQLARAQALADELLAGWRVEPPQTGSLSGRSDDGAIRWRLELDGWSPPWEELRADPIAQERFRGGLRMAQLTLRWTDALRERTLRREEILAVDRVD